MNKNLFYKKGKQMLTNQSLWKAIDKLALENNLSCSGLARSAGLDPTTFNRSKRMSKYGQPRWVSIETLAKVLNSTNTSLSEFAKYIEEQ